MSDGNLISGILKRRIIASPNAFYETIPWLGSMSDTLLCMYLANQSTTKRTFMLNMHNNFVLHTDPWPNRQLETHRCK